MPSHKKKPKSLPKAMSTAEFNRKMAAIKADKTLSASQRQALMKQMQKVRVDRKGAAMLQRKRRS